MDLAEHIRRWEMSEQPEPPATSAAPHLEGLKADFLDGRTSSSLPKRASSAAHRGAADGSAVALDLSRFEGRPGAAKRLADWLLVRGVTVVIPTPPAPESAPHATGETSARAVAGPVAVLRQYTARVSGEIREGRHVCDVALYLPAPVGPDSASQWCLELQRDYDYLDAEAIEAASIEGGMLHLGEESYRVLILDHPLAMTLATLRKVAEFAQGGGVVLLLGPRPAMAVEEGADEEARLWKTVAPEGSGDWLAAPSRKGLGEALDRYLAHDARLEEPSPHLRVLHRRSPALDFYLLVNESTEESVRGFLWLRGGGAAEAWNAETGERRRLWHYERDGIQARIPLALEPAEAAAITFTRRPDPVRVIETNLDDVEQVTDEGDALIVEGWTSQGGEVFARAVRMFDEFEGRATVPGAEAEGVPGEIRLEPRRQVRLRLEPVSDGAGGG